MLSALEHAVLDARGEQIALFDGQGRVVYLNAAARALLHGPADQVRAGLLARGGRVVRPRRGDGELGDAVVVAGPRPTLAEEERAAVREALLRAGGNRSAAARQLGISRTTLWRRLTGRHRAGVSAK